MFAIVQFRLLVCYPAFTMLFLFTHDGECVRRCVGVCYFDACGCFIFAKRVVNCLGDVVVDNGGVQVYVDI